MKKASETKKPVEIEITGKYFEGTLPSGKINKRFTGIGATTSEIFSLERNSILVLPFKALAATKVLLNRAVADTKGIKLFYWGSAYNGLLSDDLEVIEEAIKSQHIVKVCAVADSFVNKFRKNQQFILEHFHLLIDEVDIFQSDSGYREPLYYCMDIYKLFKQSRRTMISATLQGFSDEILMNEPEYVFTRKDQEPVCLDLIQSKGDFEIDLAALIIKAMDTSKSKKLIVAYSNVEGIIKTIAALNYAYEVTVLSSESSQSRLPYEWQKPIVDGKVDGQVIFLTSAYFNGIDLLMDADVIVAANTSYKFTRLQEANIVQIIGRIRNCKSYNYFLFNLNRKLASNKRTHDADLHKRIKLISFSINLITKELQKDHFTKDANVSKDLFELFKMLLPEDDKDLVRLSYSNKLEINHFKNDYLISQGDADRNFYSEYGKIQKMLPASGNLLVTNILSLTNRSKKLNFYETNLTVFNQEAKDYRRSIYLSHLDVKFKKILYYFGPELKKEESELMLQVYDLAYQLDIIDQVYKSAKLTLEKEEDKDLYRGQKILLNKLKFLLLSKNPDVDKVLKEVEGECDKDTISQGNFNWLMKKIYFVLYPQSIHDGTDAISDKKVKELAQGFFKITKVKNQNYFKIKSNLTLDNYY